MSGYYEIAKLLLHEGADVNKTSKLGHSPFWLCFTRLEEESNYFENKRLCMKMADVLLDFGV